MNDTTTVQSAVETPKEIKCGVFSGAFRLFAASWFSLLTFWGVEKPVAHKLSSDCMSQLGLALSNGDSELAAKIGKAKKNGESAFRISGKSGGTTMHNSMAIIRLVQVLEDLRYKEGFVLKSLDWQNALTDGKDKDGLKTYLAECDVWAAKQVWAKTE